MNEKSGLFIQALKEGVVPATGCTEPVAVAFAAATARDYLDDKNLHKVKVLVSPNILKNAMAVIVPGTGEPGLYIAAAAGIISGDASKNLAVISDLKETDVDKIKAMARSGLIEVEKAEVEDDLYVEVTLETAKESVSIWIAGGHTNIFKIERNGELILSKERPAPHAVSETSEKLKESSLKEIWDFALTESIENLDLMEKAAQLNMALAEEGLNGKYGLGLGASLNQSQKVGFGSGIDGDISTKMLAYTSAASDARMGGAQLPAMSNSGSGNQGITATVPICVLAEEVSASKEELIRALTMSHLSALYIHSFLPILSAFCAADSAAMGAAVGACYLMKKDYQTACNAIKNMVGDASGMICDGAGCACAMKVASSVSSMYRSVNLALQGIVIPSSNGIVCQDIDETIRGLGKLASIGMKETDKTILSIMQDK